MKSYVANCQSGYYGYQRRVVVDRPISGHEYSQCGYNQTTDNSGNGRLIQFVSYETIVCEIENDWLHCYGTFSQTTRKQMGWFMREMRQRFGYRVDLCTYYQCKDCYEKDYEINLFNGDTRPASNGMIQTVGTRTGGW